MDKQAYVQGFIQKCAEFGVDPEKLASTKLMKKVLPRPDLLERLFGAGDEQIAKMVLRKRPHMPLGPANDLQGKALTGYRKDLIPMDHIPYSLRQQLDGQGKLTDAKKTIFTRRALRDTGDVLARKAPDSVLTQQADNDLTRLQHYLDSTFGR